MSNIAIGSNNFQNVKFGNNQVRGVYLGDNLVWTNFKYILDLYPNPAHHAYSLRKLRNLYGGFCLRIRRTTTLPTVTTTTVDLSFDTNNTISFNSTITNQTGTFTAATTLGAFAAGTVDGFTFSNINVVTWYDQSGNGKNVTTSTANLQPRLVNSLTADLERSGGLVAVRFTRSASTRLSLLDTTANINNMSTYFVGAFAVSSALGGVGYSLGDITNRFYFPFTAGSNVYASYGATVPAIILQTGFNLNRHLYELISPTVGSTTLVQGFENTTAKGTFGIINASSSQIMLGNVGGGTNYYDGFIQEVIGYQSNLNRTDKEDNINTYWTIF